LLDRRGSGGTLWSRAAVADRGAAKPHHLPNEMSDITSVFTATRMGAALLGLLAACAPLQAQQNLSATKIGSRVDVTIADKFFTSYHCLADENHPCFFPVNGPSGASVTSMRNGEYPHHSSLFFGCDLVNGGNYWQEGLENIEIGKTNHSLFSARMAPDLTPACGGTLVNAAGASGEKATLTAIYLLFGSP
jgi:hypothetical protein